MFKNPIAPKVKKVQVKNPWNYEAPSYDERNMQSAGDTKGVGYNQPIGNKRGPTQFSDMLPMGRVKTMKDDNLPEAKLGMYGKNKNSSY